VAIRRKKGRKRGHITREIPAKTPFSARYQLLPNTGAWRILTVEGNRWPRERSNGESQVMCEKSFNQDSCDWFGDTCPVGPSSCRYLERICDGHQGE